MEAERERDEVHATEVLLPYAEELLHRASWPSLLRLAPWSWLEPVVVEGGSSPLLAMTCGAELVEREIYDPGVVNLARAPQTCHWTYLVLMKASVGDLGVEALTSSPHLTGLEVLKLHENHINGRGAQALAAWPGTAGVQELDLGKNELLGQSLAGVFGPGVDWGGLRRLDVSWTRCGEATWRALCDNPTLQGLETLIAFGEVREPWAERIREALPGLKTLMV